MSNPRFTDALTIKVSKWSRQDWNFWRVISGNGKATQAQCLVFMNNLHAMQGRVA